MIKLKLTAFKDTDLSREYCQDFLKGCECPVIYKNDYLVIFEDKAKAEETHFKKSALLKMTKKDLWAICDDLGIDWLNDDNTKAEIIAELENLSNQAYFEMLAENQGYQASDYDFIVCGYSQGDCVKVTRVGKAYLTKEYLTDLFFVTVCTARLTVVDVADSQFFHNATEHELAEIYLDEFLSNTYEWDRDEVIEGFKNSSYNFEELDRGFGVDMKAEIVAYLEQYLPEELTDYR